MQAKIARLLCKKGAVGGTRFELSGEAILGRDPNSTVVLEGTEVSSQHARIGWDAAAGRYQLEDLGSLNGTELDGEPVRRPEPLGRMHVITLGGAIELIYQGPELCAGSQPAASATAAPSAAGGEPAPDREHTVIAAAPMVLPGALAEPSASKPATGQTRVEERPALLPSVFAPKPALDAGPDAAPDAPTDAPTEAATEPPTWRLRVAGHGPPEGYLLSPGENRVGRLPGAEVVIEGAGISRLHAVLIVSDDGRLTVRDSESRNRTWIDDEPVTGEVELAPGAALRFGSVAATPETEQPEQPERAGPSNPGPSNPEGER